MAVLEELYLRPHHGLCIQHYIGKGYDDAFTDNMNKLVAHLKQNPYQKIILKMSNDNLCDHCPFFKDTICSSEVKVRKIDQNVLSLCGFTEGQILDWATYRNTIASVIIKNAKLKQTCEDCEWLQLCEEVTKNISVQI